MNKRMIAYKVLMLAAACLVMLAEGVREGGAVRVV